jgi:hypothetical protein
MTTEPIKCEYCDKDATKRITFVMENARCNPQSRGYGRDDISWCADAEAFACDEHNKQVERNAPEGMDYCATFTNCTRFAHMFRRKVKTATAS